MMIGGAINIISVLFLLALGLGGLLFVGLLIVLIVKALGKGGGFGREVVGGILAVLVLVVLVGLFLPATQQHRYTESTGQPNHAMSDQSWDSMRGRWEENRKEQGWIDGRYAEAQRSDGQQTDSRMELVPAPAEPTHANDNTTPATSSTPGIPGIPGITVAGNPWSDAVEQFQDFQADVYPSMRAAAQGLGLRVGSRLIETSESSDGEKRSIYVWRDESDGNIRSQNGGLVITRAVLESVATGLRQKLDGPAYVSVERPPTPGSIAVRVAIQEVTFDDHNRWGSHAQPRSGSIALRVEAPGGPFSVSTRFIDAPWVEDRNAFAAGNSKGDWLVAYSDGTHTTQEEAKRDAILAATEALLPLAKARISQLAASDQQNFTKQMHKNPDWLRDRIVDELVSRNMLTDRFSQRFDRPYGTVWREAVLIDASPKRVETLARSLVQGVNARVTHQRTTWFSYFALAGLIFGTYLFLNMATKGYYAWSLRFAVVGGIAAAVFLVRFL